MNHDTAVHTGLQVLCMVASHHGVALTEGHLVHEYQLGDRAIQPREIVKVLRDQGFTSRPARLSWAQMNDLGAGYPAILRLKNGNYVVVAGSRKLEGAGDDRELAIIDPLADRPGFIFVSHEKFKRTSDGEAVLVRRRAGSTGEEPAFGLMWFVREFLAQRAAFIHIIVAAVALIGLGLVTPLFFQIVIDKVIVHNGRVTLQVLGIGVVTAIFFEALLGYLRQCLLLYAGSRIDVRLATRVFNHLLSLPLFFFEASTSGVLSKHMQQTEAVREFLSGRVLMTALDSLALLLFIPLLFLYSPLLATVVLSFSAMVALVILAVMPAFQRALTRLYEVEGRRQAMLVETIHGIRTVKSLALEPKQREIWADNTANALESRFRVGKLSGRARSFIGFLEKLLTVVIVWIGADLVFAGRLTVGELVAVQMLAARVSQPLSALVGLVNEFQQTSLSIRMLGEIMNRRSESSAGGARLRPQFHGEIVFDRVAFTYPSGSTPALDGLTLQIRAGMSIGVVGRSGSGKSTFTRLLQGLYLPNGGQIRFDGVDIRELDSAHLRQSIGVVLQESFLFRGTVRDNIAVTRPGASLAEIVLAARSAGADEFIQRLPQGYDTFLEENAANLSGGQKQRLAIARALLPEPRILIFDEATSALDPDSEAIVQENLEHIARNRTFIAISHRLSTLVKSDAIFVFEEGRLVDIGTHPELLRRPGVYSQLWHRQNRHLFDIKHA